MILNLDEFPSLLACPGLTAEVLEMALAGDHIALSDGPVQLWEYRTGQRIDQNQIDIETNLRLVPSMATLRIDGITRYGSEAPITITAVTINGSAQVQPQPEMSSFSASVALGDPTCANSAKSPYLRCAVNPMGPCKGCDYYEREI